MRERPRFPSRLGDVLRSVLARLPASAELEDYALWTHWEEIVGATIAAHARPQRLRRGALVVAVDGPEWMQELQFLKEHVRERANARLGRPTVKRVFVVLES